MMNRTIRSLVAAAAMVWLLGLVPALAQTAQPARKGEHAGTPSSMGLQGYSVVLVIGATQGPANPADRQRDADTVPEAARKALTDMQAFLPYKRYQLLDAAWMVCCGGFRTPVSGRVRGPNDREYSYSIDTLHSADGKLTVRFLMRDETGGPIVGGISGGRGTARGAGIWTDTARLEYWEQLNDAIKERDEAEALMRRAQRQQTQMAEFVRQREVDAASLRFKRADQRVTDLQKFGSGAKIGPARSGLMDSTFSIAIGETVVIGTSRLNGDQALIAILTAAAKPGAGR